MLTALILTEIVIFFLIAWSTESENDIGSILLTIASLALAFFIIGSNPFDFIRDNYAGLLMGFVAWFAIGAGWSAFKWWRHFHHEDTAAELKSAHTYWKKRYDNDVSHIPFKESIFYKPFTLLQNKARLTRWIVFWPPSVVWTCTYRLVEKVIVWIYDALKSVYESIANSAVKRIVGTDIVTPPVPDPVPTPSSNTEPANNVVQDFRTLSK